jgi:Mn2+/Fe2+ NRAMP family transporter
MTTNTTTPAPDAAEDTPQAANAPPDGERFAVRAPGAGAGQVVARRGRLRWREVARALGPGIITGGADNDPAGITTYSVVGAQSGFSLNWLLLISTPLLIVIQQMAARIGNVTKSDLASAIRMRYGARLAVLAVLLTVLANLLTIGADLQMMAAVAALIFGGGFTAYIVPFAAVMGYITIFGNYKLFARFLLWLAAVFALYIVAAVLARPNWGQVLAQTVIPHIHPSATYFIAAVGLLGTTITPYLFFWQTSGEVEERRGVQSMARTRLDITAGMIWSNVTAFFIIVVTGTLLYNHHTTITTAADAAKALGPVAGPYAKYLFAVGIIGAGLLAVPVLAASTAYSIAGIFGWRRSLARRVHNAPEFYIVLGVALMISVQLAVIGADPVKTLFYSQVLDGLIAPLLVVLLVLLTSSRKVMGDFINSRAATIIGWIAVGVLVAADVAMVFSIVTSGFPG